MSTQLSLASLFSVLAMAAVCLNESLGSGALGPMTTGGLTLTF